MERGYMRLPPWDVGLRSAHSSTRTELATKIATSGEDQEHGTGTESES